MTVTATTRTSDVTPRVQLRLLGGFELRVDGDVVDLQPAVRRLTALVALTPCGLARDFAAFQLWPDKSEARARANLRSTLWRLHQLAADMLHASATHLRLDESVWVDTRYALAENDSDNVLPRPFETLVADLLPDWYDDWIGVERERFRQLRLAQLERRARAALQEQDFATAIQQALAALSIDPTRNTTHRILVQAHLAEGNEWEAARERFRYSRCLQDYSADA